MIPQFTEDSERAQVGFCKYLVVLVGWHK